MKKNYKLWTINLNVYRGMNRLNKEKIADTKINFLNLVKIENHILGDVLEASEMYNIALTSRIVSFTTGNIITKEGDKGNTFYIIKRKMLMYITKLVGIIQLLPWFQDSSLGRRHYYTKKVFEQQHV